MKEGVCIIVVEVCKVWLWKNENGCWCCKIWKFLVKKVVEKFEVKKFKLYDCVFGKVDIYVFSGRKFVLILEIEKRIVNNVIWLL